MNRDLAYWEEAFHAFYIQANFGKYDEALDAFLKAYPEFREFYEDYGQERARKELTKRLARRFREIDEREHDENLPPVPPHIRDQFLPFSIDVPPMSPSINGHDGQGRIGMLNATPKQHLRHHIELKKFHDRGYRYREGAEGKWRATIEDLKRRLDATDHPENETMRELLVLLVALKVEMPA